MIVSNNGRFLPVAAVSKVAIQGHSRLSKTRLPLTCQFWFASVKIMTPDCYLLYSTGEPFACPDQVGDPFVVGLRFPPVIAKNQRVLTA